MVGPFVPKILLARLTQVLRVALGLAPALYQKALAQLQCSKAPCIFEQFGCMDRVAWYQHFFDLSTEVLGKEQELQLIPWCSLCPLQLPCKVVCPGGLPRHVFLMLNHASRTQKEILGGLGNSR